MDDDDFLIWFVTSSTASFTEAVSPIFISVISPFISFSSMVMTSPFPCSTSPIYIAWSPSISILYLAASPASSKDLEISFIFP